MLGTKMTSNDGIFQLGYIYIFFVARETDVYIFHGPLCVAFNSVWRLKIHRAMLSWMGKPVA